MSTYYVCENLDSSGVCVSWISHTDPTFLPELTLAQGNEIGAAILVLFATVFVIKMCIKAIQ